MTAYKICLYVIVIIILSAPCCFPTLSMVDGFSVPTEQINKSQPFNQARNSSDAWVKDGVWYWGHTGVDLAGGGNITATASGEVVKAEYDSGYGYMVRIKHLLNTGHIVYSQYGHMLKGLSVKVGDKVIKGQKLGVMGNTGFSTGVHLHFEIKKVNSDGFGYARDNKAILVDYYNPLSFIECYNKIGSTGSVSFISLRKKYFDNAPKIGYPYSDNNGGVYVHEWVGFSNSNNSVFLQNFQGDMEADHFGLNGQSAIILNDFADPVEANLVKGEFWEYYRHHDGPSDIGVPFTQEVSAYYADSYHVSDNDFVKPLTSDGNVTYLTVQKFRVRPKSGDYDETKRRTLVLNHETGDVERFGVGLFSIGCESDAGIGQWYMMDPENLLDPSRDKPWPRPGVENPTGFWWTKSGTYHFVRHDANGNRINSSAFSVDIYEGNQQFSDSVPIVVEAPTELSVNCTASGYVSLSWDGGVNNSETTYRVRRNVENNYENAVVVAVQGTSYVDSSVSVGGSYYYWVSAVNNGLESDISMPVFITAEKSEGGDDEPVNPPQSGDYVFGKSVICGDAEEEYPYMYSDEKYEFNNGEAEVISWVELNDVNKQLVINWEWYTPGGLLTHEYEDVCDNPADEGYEYWDWYRLWNGIGIQNSNEYGEWLVKIYVDNELVKIDKFELKPELVVPTGLVVNEYNGGIKVSWQTVVNASGYKVYKNGELFATTVSNLFYNDIDVEYGESYCYRVRACFGEYESAKTTSVCHQYSVLPPLSTPSGVNAENVSSSQNSISWQAVTNACEYLVYRNGVVYAEGITDLFYNDIAIEEGVDYCYEVSAKCSDNESEKSASECARYDAPKPLSVPSGVSVVNNNSPENILTWEEVPDADGYRVYKNGVFLVEIFNDLICVDDQVESGVNNCYKVSAYRGDEETEKSVLVCAQYDEWNPLVLPKVVVKKNTPTTNMVIWGRVPGVCGYKIYKDGTLIATVTDALQYEISGAELGVSYCYEVSTFCGEEESERTEVQCVQYNGEPMAPMCIKFGKVNKEL